MIFIFFSLLGVLAIGGITMPNTFVANTKIFATQVNANFTAMLDEINRMTTVTPSAKTSAYTILSTDKVVLTDGTSAAFTVTLPPAAGVQGQTYIIKKVDSSANAITVDANGSETIDGAATKDLTTQYDFVSLISDGANWLIISGGGGSGSQIVQTVKTESTVAITGIGVFPADDTIPQNNEGVEFITRAITPTDVNNILIIEATLHINPDSSYSSTTVIALFQDATANALSAVVFGPNGASTPFNTVYLRYEMVAGTTSATTFKIRAARSPSQASNSITINGVANNVRRYGGILVSTLKITEKTP